MVQFDNLKDELKRREHTLQNDIDLLRDIKEFSKEYSILEKEHCKNIEALAKKYASKTEQKKAYDAPAQSCFAIWQTMINELQSTTKSIQKSWEDGINPVVDSIRRFHKQQDDLFRKFIQFQHDIISNCEKQISDCDKNRTKYIDAFIALVKIGNATGESSIKVEKKIQDLSYDNQIKKVSYILGNASANSSLQFLVKKYLPEIEEVLRMIKVQQLWASLFESLNCSSKLLFDFWSKMHSEVLKMDPVEDVDFSILNIEMDSKLTFANNVDHTDTEAISDQINIKPFLMNIYSQLLSKIKETQSSLQYSQKEIQTMTSLMNAQKGTITAANVSDYEQVYSTWFNCKKQYLNLLMSISSYESQIQMVKNYLGNEVPLDQSKPHMFKASSFASSAQCNFCLGSIWGLTRNTGYICEDCGYLCHFRCQPKILDYCGRVTHAMNSNQSPSLKKKDEDGLGNNDRGDPTKNLISRPELKGRTTSSLFTFNSENPEELCVTPSDTLVIIDENIDNGWIKVRKSDDMSEGFVPLNFLAIYTNELSVVKATHSYEAAEPDELSFKIGDLISVMEKFDDGWCLGECDGLVGVFPSNYVAMEE